MVIKLNLLWAWGGGISRVLNSAQALEKSCIRPLCVAIMCRGISTTRWQNMIIRDNFTLSMVRYNRVYQIVIQSAVIELKDTSQERL